MHGSWSVASTKEVVCPCCSAQAWIPLATLLTRVAVDTDNRSTISHPYMDDHQDAQQQQWMSVGLKKDKGGPHSNNWDCLWPPDLESDIQRVSAEECSPMCRTPRLPRPLVEKMPTGLRWGLVGFKGNSLSAECLCYSEWLWQPGGGTKYSIW